MDSSSSTKAVVLTGSKSSNDSTFTIMKSSDGLYKIPFGSADKPMELGLEKLDDRGTWVHTTRLETRAKNTGFTGAPRAMPSKQTLTALVRHDFALLLELVGGGNDAKAMTNVISNNATIFMFSSSFRVVWIPIVV
ncbi:hypothetical protein YC2023_106210 [Brassica napus]